VADGTGILIVPSAGGPVRITQNGGDGPPAWSPDGDSLVYYSLVSFQTGNTDLFLVEPSSGNVRSIARTSGSELYPVWSSDGRYIAYEVEIWPPEGTPRIEVRYMDVGKGITRSVPSAQPYNTKPTWSPVSQRIAYLSSDTPGGSTGSNLQIFDLETRAISTLTNHDEVDQASWPKWSPDGRSIVVAIGESAGLQSDLGAIDVATGAMTRLTDDGIGNGQPDWSPDGTKLAFSSLLDDRGRILVLDLATGERSTLIDDPNIHADLPHWSPDGSALAFVYTTFDSGRIGSERYARGLGLAFAYVGKCIAYLPFDTLDGGLRLAPTQAWQPLD
jgi:TolB protein